MSDYDYGPLQTYEITWTSGHIEHIKAHQVTYSGDSVNLSPFSIATKTSSRRVHFHGSFEGQWLLVLSAREEDIAAIRLVTGGETFLGSVFHGEAATEEKPGGDV